MKNIYLIFIICLSYNGLFAQDLLMQDGIFNQCSGNFYDTGGLASDYSTSENLVITICPDGPNLETTLEFTTFLLSNDGGDSLTIYDADIADPAEQIGTYTGTLANNPELNFVAATNPSGCLTIEFVSNVFFNGEGWEAIIGCRPPCQTITPEILSIEPTCGQSGPNTLIPINQPVTFNGGATTSSGDVSDLSYSWNFGGNILNGQSVSPTFPNAGIVNIGLTVTDSFGCSETINSIYIVGDNVISIDDTNFTLDQLVGDVLISGTCSDVNNITSPNNAALNGQGYESYAYFNNECSSFPFDEGIVMGSSNVNQVITGAGGGGGWPGDPDLEALIQQPGNTNDATVIEFEFTPYVDEIQFNYIFASYEYPTFVCNFADTFAFILSGPGISNINDYDHDGNPGTPDVTLDLGGLNIALVPGTTTPVSPVNVHDETGCGPGQLGEFAFPQFYDATNSEANNPGDIDVTGRTRILTAQASVIPGQTYTIKLAIADRGDTILDSYVFLEGGSFELGANIGEDLVLDDVSAVCEGETQTLQVFEGIAPPGFTFQWTKDGVPLAGETGPSLDVTESGEYCIDLAAGTDCDSSDCAIVEFIPVFNPTEDISDNLDLTLCDPFLIDPVFDLTVNDNLIYSNISNEFFSNFVDFQNDNPGVDPYQVIYYETLNDAQNGTNPITDPENFSPNPLNFPFTIHYVVEDTFGLNCSSVNTLIGDFTLDITEPLIGTPADLNSCSDTPGANTAIFDLTQNDTLVLDGQDPNTFTVSYFLNEQDAIDNVNAIADPGNYQNISNPQTMWVRLQDPQGPNCCQVNPFDIGVFVTPEISIPPQNLAQCGDFTLTQSFNLTSNDAVSLGITNPGNVNVSYHNTQADADANTNPVTSFNSYNPSNNFETIFIRVENINASDCFVTDSFEVEIYDVEANQPQDIEVCTQTGNTGQTTFDLTTQNDDVFGPNQDSTTHSISYHNSQADASGGANPIANPDNYTSASSPETIWVRVQNINEPTCFDVTSFDLIITEQPEIVNPPVDLSVCGDFTGTQTIDLTQNDVAALGILNPSETALSYYNTSQADADAGANAIADPVNYNPSANTETIFIRAENTGDATCFVTSSFTVQIFDVEANQPQDIEVCTQTGNTGQTTFDLTTQNDDVFGPNQDSTTHSISYHNSQADANSGVNPIATPDNYTNNSNPETIWVRVENNDDTECFAVTSFDLIITEQPEIVNPPVDLSVCGDFTGTQTIDLTQNDVAALGILNPSETTLSYYNTSQADADAGANAIADPANYNPSANTETIFIRAENTGDATCFVTSSFTVQIFDVEANQPQDIEICDATGASGQTEFNLLQQNAVIFGPNQNSASHTITYYNSQADATAGTNSIADPNTYTNSSNPETVWTRVENNNDPNCFAITSFDLIVVEEPEVVNPAVDLFECGNFTGIETFDLTQNDDVALGVVSTTNFTYHNTQADANAGLNPIADPVNYNASSNPETIFIRIENSTDASCFTTTSFEVERFEVEALLGNDLESCDDGSGTATSTFDLTQNNAPVLGPNQTVGSHNISYHLTQTEAETGDNPINNPEVYANISSPQIIWVRVENQNNTDCFEVSSFELLVTDSAPINTNISPLIACDDDNDGFFNNFDLSSKDDEIHFGNTDVAISYHLTSADAQNAVGALSSPYANVVESIQTIFFLAVDTNNGCEQFGSFELQIFDSPLLTPVTVDLVGCDEDNDGFLFFDLTQVEAEALGSLDPANLEITYHLSLADAQAGLNPIADAENYLNTNPVETIWIRVLDISNPHGCFDIEAFDIIVEPTPSIVDPEPLEICDDEESGDLSDEIATFDLNDKISEITLGNNELNVEFFESQTDLDNDNPIAPIDAYINIANPQTLEVRVTSGTNGCESFTTLTLVVNPVPSMAPVLQPLEICDPDNDGFAEFDLDAAIIDILNNEPDVTITFHLTLADAELGVNPIDTSQPFGTNNPNQQTLYVRAENTGPNGDDGTGCFDTRPLDLIVVPSPEIDDLVDLSRCDDDTPNGFASFDLTVNTPLALGSQDPADLTVTYHETQADAEQGTNPIAVPSNYTNITNPQIIYVRIFDEETGCYDLFNSADDVNNSFTLTVEPLPVVNTPSILEVCDDDDNQTPFPQTAFDLTVKEAEIAGVPVVPANLEFTYYESQVDFDNDNPIADPTAYVNTAQPQSIFIRVVDNATENACFDSTTLTISVLPLPSPSETDPDVLRLEACDDDGNDGVAANPFDLTQSGVLIAGSENVDLSYYLSEEAALAQDNNELIADPAAYVNDPALNLVDEDGNPTNTQVIYVRVDNAVAGNFCFVIVPIELVVYPAPILNPLGDPFGYTLCEDDSANPGVAMLFSTDDVTNNLYDFTNGSSDVIIPLLDPNIVPEQNLDDFTVTYHTTEVDAENGTNPVAPGLMVSDGDILFIRVTNSGTDCFNTRAIAQVQIVIEPRPAIAQDDPDNLPAVCADAIDSPGSGTFDLTVQDDLINPGAPADTFVVYYAGMMNYNDGIVIDDPSNFTTTQSPQTIIAEVVNAVTLCESSTFVSFEVFVNPLPDVDISGADGAIVCIDSAGNVINNDVSPPTIDTGLSDADYTFIWSVDGTVNPVFTGASIQATIPGIYSVQVTDNQTGCVANSNTAEILQSSPPEFILRALTPSFSGTHVIEVSEITGSGDFEFQLDDGPFESLAPGQTSIVYTGLAPGLHTVRGRDNGGCGIIEKTIMLIDYPPFFTPNQDGVNETWNITSLSDQPNAKIYIFDRYGKLLKQINPAGQGWDGTFNGNPMPSQDYWFSVEFEEPTTMQKSIFKAHFTLKR